jgi:imidazolonepropionase
MAAHAVPKNFENSTQYMDKLVIPLLEELQEEIDIVDIFFEKDYFNKEDTIKLFHKAKELNIPTKVHADEFNDNKGAVLAAKYNSLSADHLLCTSSDGVEALSKSNTVATILPGTALFLGKKLVDARLFLDAGVKVALASDYNPGSCHCDNLLLIASITAKNLGLNICELWASITYNAACALGLEKTGYIEVGASSSLSLFDASSIDQITYNWGKNLNIKF